MDEQFFSSLDSRLDDFIVYCTSSPNGFSARFHWDPPGMQLQTPPGIVESEYAALDAVNRLLFEWKDLGAIDEYEAEELEKERIAVESNGYRFVSPLDNWARTNSFFFLKRGPRVEIPYRWGSRIAGISQLVLITGQTFGSGIVVQAYGGDDSHTAFLNYCSAIPDGK
jgi:hypothetical protein